MMRRYHRWLAILFGAFLLWIAATGAIVQFSRMTAPERPRPAAAAPAPAPESREAEEEAGPDATRQFIHFVTELHSGEEFGLAGQIISLLSGLALVFFSVSGLYLYIQMWRGRLVRVEQGKTVRGGKWFWR